MSFARWIPVLLLISALFVGCACGDDDPSTSSGQAPTDDDDSGVADDSTDDFDDVADDGADDTSGDDTGDTWTDSSSGLTWQVNPSSDYLMWDDAKSYCDNLSLAGAGWHLPTISELRTLIRGCDATETGISLGSCLVTDSCLDYDCQNDLCWSCDYDDGPNNGCYGPSELPGECDWYWSSSPVADSSGYDAWYVYFLNGGINNSDIDFYTLARCVRP